MDALFFLSNSEFFLAIRGGPYMTPVVLASGAVDTRANVGYITIM